MMIKLIKRLLGMQEEILEIEIICEDAEPLPLPEIIERHFDLADFEAWLQEVKSNHVLSPEIRLEIYEDKTFF